MGCLCFNFILALQGEPSMTSVPSALSEKNDPAAAGMQVAKYPLRGDIKALLAT
jgi:hypothetical protein